MVQMDQEDYKISGGVRSPLPPTYSASMCYKVTSNTGVARNFAWGGPK